MGDLRGSSGVQCRRRDDGTDGLGKDRSLGGYVKIMREFDTGATRDTDVGKYDYEGFMSPLVQRRFGEFMNKHRKQSDGKLRDSDNWQRGIPLDQYIKSGKRHLLDWWLIHRRFGYLVKESLEDVLCAILFNVQGYLHEVLKKKHSVAFIEYTPGGRDDPTIKNRD